VPRRRGESQWSKRAWIGVVMVDCEKCDFVRGLSARSSLDTLCMARQSPKKHRVKRATRDGSAMSDASHSFDDNVSVPPSR
jgi:hypothetical protein